mmetsp:Transcript_16912/g.47201  ORF Transcript_16912/g.47201 Transcript_16912/m.47201 type:complete len:530 (+) Transcript_16912:41-1630(+)
MADANDGGLSLQLAVVWSLLIVTVVCAFFLQRYRVHICPPSSAAMLLGMVFGFFVRLVFKKKQLLSFSPSIFFYGLLPPIVLSAGFNLKKRNFFKNFGSIMLFAVLGTIISTLVFGLMTYLLMVIGLVQRHSLGDNALVLSLLYGSLISAIDPVATLAVFADIEVPSLLYNLVFGESVLNDAVAIVLFNTFEDFYETPVTATTIPLMIWRFVYIFIGSAVIGVAVSLPAAFVLKRFQLSGMSGGPSFDGTLYEIAILFMDAYMAYLASEAAGMSGIASLFMAGICHAHYSYYSVHEDSKTTVKKSMEAAAFLAETFLFAYLGMQVFMFNHVLDWGLLLSGIPLCLLSRAANIFPCARLANMGRAVKIPKPSQCMQWAVGLRGAVSYGLVVHLPTLKHGQERYGNPAIETATLFIVCTSTLVLGGSTVHLLRYFKLDGESAANDQTIAGTREKGGLHLAWKSFDRQYLKPVFGGRDSGSLPGSSAPGLLSRLQSGETGTAASINGYDDNEHHVEYQELGGQLSHDVPSTP